MRWETELPILRFVFGWSDAHHPDLLRQRDHLRHFECWQRSQLDSGDHRLLGGSRDHRHPSAGLLHLPYLCGVHGQHHQGNHQEDQGRFAAGEPVVQGRPAAHRLLQRNICGGVAEAEDGSGADETRTQADMIMEDLYYYY